MGAWVQVSRGRAVYAGRIARPPFIAWTETPEGRVAVDELASRIRFSFVGKRRAARRRLWRQLAAMADDEVGGAAIQDEVQAYLQRPGRFAFADGLPRTSVELHRLVVVPCVLLNSAAYRAIEGKLNTVPKFASLEGGRALREFFILRLIKEIETALARARPSPKHPLAAGDEWITVGLNPGFVWRLPLLQEPPWNGHHYLLELTRQPITRAIRRAAAASIGRFEEALQSISRTERGEILRRAERGA